ncbi:MAG TPA: hypothetical protein VI504_08595 [Candidatus Eisenbacteria bacterium]|jgi:hypothetical protein
MPFPTRRLTHFLLATIATVAALGLGACSRSQHITDSLTGLRADGAASFAAGGNGHGRGHGQKPPPPPPGGSANPCVSLTGLGGTVVNASAGIVQFRATRLRIDVTGDVAAGTINTTGTCAATTAPAVSYFSGTGSLVLGGSATSVTASGGALTFGPLLFPGLALEPGVVLATDANGNVLEIIWPALAGLPAGPPVLRFQLAHWSAAVQTGAVLDATMQFNAMAPDGTTAAFNVAANGLVVPVQQ